jgi:hypothetical protein
MTGSRGASRSLSIAADASEHRCRLMNDRGLTMTATVFLVLLAGHLLGDWVAQTELAGHHQDPLRGTSWL